MNPGMRQNGKNANGLLPAARTEESQEDNSNHIRPSTPLCDGTRFNSQSTEQNDLIYIVLATLRESQRPAIDISWP